MLVSKDIESKNSLSNRKDHFNWKCRTDPVSLCQTWCFIKPLLGCLPCALIGPALGAREPHHSGVSRAYFLHVDREMPGKFVLGPLPWTPCAPRMKLCFDGPSSILLTLAPGERRGYKYEVTVTRSLGTAWQGIGGATQVARDVLSMWNHPHCKVETSKVDTTRERLWCLSQEKAANWTEAMTHKTRKCFETSSFLRKKKKKKKKKKKEEEEEEEKKKYVCLFFLSTELNI